MTLYRYRTAAAAIAAIGGLVLAGCGGDPLADPESGGGSGQDSSSGNIVVGSQDYYSNEIIAETYAQVLESDGYSVEREMRIGQREVYLPEIENGSIDVFPEYSGPLLQYWDSDTDVRKQDEVDAALADAVPDGLRVLDSAPAADQDSYAVTKEFAQKWNLKTIADLAKVDEPLTLGGNSEAEDRPNGPKGLKSAYGVDADFTPIEDGGGPLTVKALKDNSVQLAIIYSADPSIAKDDLVVLDDPKGLFLSSNVVPLVSDAVDEKAATAIDSVNEKLTSDDLIAMNRRSVDEKIPAQEIAADWLQEKGLD